MTERYVVKLIHWINLVKEPRPLPRHARSKERRNRGKKQPYSKKSIFVQSIFGLGIEVVATAGVSP